MNKTLNLFLLTTALAVKAVAQVEYVNPMIGTDGMGHTFPGACVPFGIVQLSPDTDTIPKQPATRKISSIVIIFLSPTPRPISTSF